MCDQISKICRVCKIEKPIEQITWQWKSKGYRSNICINCHTKAKTAKRKLNPEKEYARTRNRHLKNKYGITTTDYDTMFSIQKGLCRICKKPQAVYTNNFNKLATQFLAVDHCHSTGKVRGLLCTDCNIALGLLKDNPTTASRMKHYLLHHQSKVA